VVFFNYTTMQMTAKIVYYGPGLCGKTTNLQAIHHRTAPRSRGEMVSLETETDRTLFFDLLPLEVGVIGGMKVRLQLYTVPGQVFYNATRKLVLKGVDGVVFVADSQVAALETNQESLQNLRVNLAELGLGFDQVPVVFQYNKRDIRNILPIEKLNEVLNPGGSPYFEAAALHGIGVFETLKTISRLAIASVRKKLAPEEAAPQAPPAAPVPPPARATPLKAAAAVPAPVEEQAAPEPAADTGNPLEALIGSDVPAVEFAQEDTDKHVVPVTTKGQVDIHQELEKLRTLTGTARRATAAAPRSQDMDRRLQDMLGVEQGSKQDLKRKGSVDVPADVLKTADTLRIQLSFETAEGEVEVHDALTIRLGSNRRLERVGLHLDLDIKGKG
jgi:signal recognition particle receptor subunit beta